MSFFQVSPAVDKNKIFTFTKQKFHFALQQQWTTLLLAPVQPGVTV